MNLKLLLVLALLLQSFGISAQFAEKQLPEPSRLSSLFIGPLLKSTIHYGAAPTNFDGNVIVFNHGYIDLNQLFFTNNDFYQQAYDAGYQVVFVATTRGKGMWENGKLLAQALDKITKKYGVQQVQIIAHSNGGKAAEVAMYKYGKYDKVSRVIALGTPYWGTYLADISQQWWFNWLWKKTGLNEGSATSTTYYCREVVRPYFDKHPNNEPEKFYLLGGSGFAKGHTLLAPAMLASGLIIYAKQGANDGVTPYSSSLRPNGHQLFKKNELGLDHVDIALGQHVWKYIAPLLQKSSNSKSVTSSTYRQQPTFDTSNYQIVHVKAQGQTITLDKQQQAYEIAFIPRYHGSKTELIVNDKKLRPEQFSRHEFPAKSTGIPERTLTIAGTKGLAFIKDPNGPTLMFKSDPKQQQLSLQFDRNVPSSTSGTIYGIITRKATITGVAVTERPIVLNFSKKAHNKGYILRTNKLKNGIYSIHIEYRSATLRRSLLSGFTLGKPANGISSNTETGINSQSLFRLKNHVIQEYLHIKSLNKSSNETQRISISLYDLNGREVIQDNMSLTARQYQPIDLGHLSSGIYLVTVRSTGRQQSFKIVKQ